jgi:hypothetical protein
LLDSSYGSDMLFVFVAEPPVPSVYLGEEHIQSHLCSVRHYRIPGQRRTSLFSSEPNRIYGMSFAINRRSRCGDVPRPSGAGWRPKQTLQASTLSWAFVSRNSLPSLRIANKENSATPSAEDRCMVEGRALTTPRLCKTRPPHLVALQGRVG